MVVNRKNLLEGYASDTIEEARTFQVVLRYLFDFGNRCVSFLIFVLLAKAENEIKVKQYFNCFVQELNSDDGVLPIINVYLIRLSEGGIESLTESVIYGGEKEDHVKYCLPIALPGYHHIVEEVECSI